MSESQNDSTGAGGNAPQNGIKTDDLQSKDNIFDNRPGHKKIIRLVTVMAYLFSVSFVAIALSGYYVFIWRPPNRGSTSRARTMSRTQTQDFAENSLAQFPINNNETNTTGIYNGMNDFKNKVSQHGGINISSDKSFQLNERILNSTGAVVNPISTQTYQNKTDKVKTDTRSDIYSILNGRTDVSVEARNLETSTLFMRLSNTSESLTSTDLPFPTEQIIEEERINSSDRWNFVKNQHIHQHEIVNVNEISLSDEPKLNNDNQTVTTGSTVDSVELLFTPSIESSNTRARKNHEGLLTNKALQIDY